MRGFITYLDRVERQCCRCGLLVTTTARNFKLCATCRKPINRARNQIKSRIAYHARKAERAKR